jgi:hypothetical protein
MSDDVYAPPPGGYIDTPFGNSVFGIPIPVDDFGPGQMKKFGTDDPKDFAWNMFEGLSRLMTDKAFRDYMTDGDPSQEKDTYERFAVPLFAGVRLWKPEVSELVEEIVTARLFPLVLICRSKERGMRIAALSIGAAAPDDMVTPDPAL